MIQSVRRSVYSVFIVLLPWILPASAEERQGEPKTIEALIATLGEADASARVQAIGDLAERGAAAQPAVSALIRATDDRIDEVRRAAVIALGQLSLEPDSTIPALISVMAEPTSVQGAPMNALAGFALAEFGKPAIPHLIEALRSDSLHVRRGALAGIYRCGPLAKDAVHELIAILREDDPQTRNFVLNTLMGIGPDAKDAVPAVIEMLANDNFHTQYWACRVLGAIGPDAQSATDELVQLVPRGVASVRRNAAAALGNIGPSIGPEGVQALIEALTDDSQPVKQAAVIALSKLKPISESAADVIEELLLQEPTPFSPRANAARTLWLLRPESERVVADALLRDLSRDNEPWLAARFLAEIDFTEDIVSRIVPLLQSDRLWVRRHAAEALGNLGPDAASAKSALEPLLQDDAEEVREAAAEALKKMDGTATP